MLWGPMLERSLGSWDLSSGSPEAKIVKELTLPRACAIAVVALQDELERGDATSRRLAGRAKNLLTDEIVFRRERPRRSDIPALRRCSLALALSPQEHEAVAHVARVLCLRLLEVSGAATRKWDGNVLRLYPRPQAFHAVKEILARRLPPRRALLPMVYRPRAWAASFGGGYLSPRLAFVPLIRSRDRAQLLDFDDRKPREVLEAVNFAQAAARFRVDRRLLEEAAGSIGRPAWPGRGDRHAALRALRTLSIADLRKHRASLWFPVHLDFRGRLYPLPSPLSYQGDDLAQALLELDEPAPATTPPARAALYRDLSKCATGRRLSDTELESFRFEHDRRLESVAHDPASHLPWLRSCDKPWRVISLCRAITHPTTARATVTLDATASGLQMLAVLFRDQALARLTNLTFHVEREDIYTFAAAAAGAALADMDRLATPRWLAWLPEGIPRSLAKSVLMPMSYGLSPHGCHDAVHRWVLDECAVRRERVPFGPYYGSALHGLSIALWRSIARSFPVIRNFNVWCWNVSRVAFDRGRTLTWTLPDGFRVFHAPRATLLRPVPIHTLGTRIFLSDAPREDLRGYRRSLAANILQSADAFVMRETLRRAKADGLEFLASHHDAYSCRPEDRGRVYLCARDAYRALAASNPFESILSELDASFGRLLPEPPPMGTFDTAEIASAKHILA